MLEENIFDNENEKKWKDGRQASINAYNNNSTLSFRLMHTDNVYETAHAINRDFLIFKN